MVEFVSRYDKLDGMQYSNLLTNHGAFYGTTGSGKSYLIKDLCENGMFKHCRTIVFLNGKSTPLDEKFRVLMMERWKTQIYSYNIQSEAELTAKINEIEQAFIQHRIKEYAKLKRKPPDEVSLEPNMAFGNMLLVIDDLHKEAINSNTLIQKFQAIRHVGMQLLFITQSFKNVGLHDVIKENLGYVVFFKLSQNKQTLRSYLSELSIYNNTSRTSAFRSSLEYIFHKLVRMNDQIMTFKDEETSYLYIEIPKRSRRNVTCVRTAISNPHRQICFQELDHNSIKIHFSTRVKPLTYENRFQPPIMRVMNEDEQNKEIDQLNYEKEKEVDNTSAKDEESSDDDVGETHCESGDSEKESTIESDECLNSSTRENIESRKIDKRNLFNTSSVPVKREQQQQQRLKYVRGYRSSLHISSNDSELESEDEIYYSERPPKHVVKKIKKQIESDQSSHSKRNAEEDRREQQYRRKQRKKQRSEYEQFNQQFDEPHRQSQHKQQQRWNNYEQRQRFNDDSIIPVKFDSDKQSRKAANKYKRKEC